jgi:holo-[acyl-carrier protein] synthase
MIHAIGTDLIEIERIQTVFERTGERFLKRILTEAEREYCMGKTQPGPSLAARFAAKEAVMKCLGTGWTQGVIFRDIEVTRTKTGAPGIELHGRSGEIAAEQGITSWHLSLSHSLGHALAMVVAEREEGR